MPAVVRGGRRQAQQPGKGAPSAKSASATSGGRARKGAHGARTGKFKAIGGVPMPNELTAWLAFLALAALLSAVLLTGGRAELLRLGVVNFIDGRIATVGLNLQDVRLQGVSDDARADIKKALHFERGQPIALMDLAKVKAEVEKVGWVKSAVIRRQLPNQLIISVVERPRLAVWQYQKKTYVIDDTGQIIPEARAYNFVHLPLIVGEGANEQASDILDLLRARPDLLSRTEALVRIDTRRWDIRLKNGTLIKLPALEQEEAMNRLDGLILERRVLDQGFAEVDLLDPNTLVVVPFETGGSL